MIFTYFYIFVSRKMIKSQLDIVIIGGKILGTCCAFHIAQYPQAIPRKVTVFDSGNHKGATLNNMAIAQSGMLRLLLNKKLPRPALIAQKLRNSLKNLKYHTSEDLFNGHGIVDISQLVDSQEFHREVKRLELENDVFPITHSYAKNKLGVLYKSTGEYYQIPDCVMDLDQITHRLKVSSMKTDNVQFITLNEGVTWNFNQTAKMELL